MRAPEAHSVSSSSASATGLLAQRVGVPTQLDHIEAGLESPTGSGVHNDAHGGILIELTPGESYP